MIYRPDNPYEDLARAIAYLYDHADEPTYACVEARDGIASWNTMKSRLDRLQKLGIPTEFHKYEGLSHGFGCVFPRVL